MKKKKIKKNVKLTKSLNFEDVRVSSRELESIKPPAPMNPLDFFKYIRVPTDENARGQLDLELTPYLMEPIKQLANYDYEAIFCIGPTQSGKTVIAQTAVAYSIDQDPGPLLYCYPDENTAEKALDKKIIGMINSTPRLKEHLRTKRALTKQSISLDTMSIDVAWSNSPATMNVLPKKRVIGDEIRLFKLMVGKESNAIKLMQDRLTTYLDLGIAQALFISSPSTEGDLLHQQLDVSGTLVLKWYVPCPDCNKYQSLDFWLNVKKPKTEKTLAFCACKYCGGLFPDDDKKRSWNNLGVYAPENSTLNADGTIKHVQDSKKYTRIVFWWDSLVSPFRSFDRIWNEFKRTEKKIQDYKNFIQGWLAEFWKDTQSKTNEKLLKSCRRNYYSRGEVPKGVQVLLSGIDTQDDSLFVVTYGFGGDKTWLIDEDRIMCEIPNTNEEDIEGIIFANVMNRLYYDADGKPWKVGLAAWDSGGHRTKMVYEVVRRFPRLVAIKGRNNQMRTISWSEKETHYNIRTIEYLEETEFIAQTDRFNLPHNVSLEFMVQFANRRKETLITKSTGAPKTQWMARGPDHFRHASCYCFSCLDIPMSKIGIIRSRLKDKNFSYNPVNQNLTRKKEDSENDSTSEFIKDPFEIAKRISKNKSNYNSYDY